MRLLRFSSESGTIALCNAMRLLVVSGSETQKSRRCQPLRGRKCASIPPAPPGAGNVPILIPEAALVGEDEKGGGSPLVRAGAERREAI